MSDDAGLRSAIAALVTELGSLRRRVELVENRAGVQQAFSGLDPDPEQPAQVLPQRVEANPDTTERDRWDVHMSAWVPWLVDTYRLHETVPPCWPAHPQLVEELTSLWLMWRDAWLTPATPSAPVAWHVALANMVGRTKSLWPVACDSAGGHRSVTASRWLQVTCSPVRLRWWTTQDGVGR